jgi:hypothetical protein
MLISYDNLYNDSLRINKALPPLQFSPALFSQPTKIGKKIEIDRNSSKREKVYMNKANPLAGY